MRMSFCSILVMLATACALSAQTEDPALFGRWRPVRISRGGIGALWEFAPGGSVTFSPAAIIPGKYRVTGKQIWISGDDEPGKESPFDIVVLNEGEFRFKSPKGIETALRRRGDVEDPANLLLGSWTGLREMNGRQLTSEWQFHADGTQLFILPFRTDNGTYSLEHGGIEIRVNTRGVKPIRGVYRLEKETLYLPSVRRAGEARYVRY